MFTPIYFYMKKGTEFSPCTLVGTHAVRTDYIEYDNGDKIGRALARSGRQVREALDKDGFTVVPPLHRPIKAPHVQVFSYVNASEGELAYDVIERLYEHHKVHWLHPEETST